MQRTFGISRLYGVVLIVILALGIGFMAGNISPSLFVARAQGGQPAGTEELFKPFWEAWNVVHQKYVDVDKLDDRKLMEGAATGMVASLGDTHSAYMDPDFFSNVNSELSGQFDGIGATVQKDDKTGGLKIVSVMDQSPARGILKGGDIIMIVDGTDVTTLPEMQIVSKVRGPAGSTVKLSVLRSGQNKLVELTITRAHITLPTVVTAMYEGNVGYIKLADFNDNATADFAAGLQKLNANHLKGLIFDLRDNPGGGLQTAIDIASQFLDSGTVLIYRGRPGTPEIKYVSTGKSLAPTVPLVVLVNESSASASELVSGALQDRGRARVVGVKSFGKGSVQQWSGLSDGGGIRITIAHFFKPSGGVIDHIGIIPNVIVPWDRENSPQYDPQLNEALWELFGKF